MNTFVTGASGFIGGAVARALSKQGTVRAMSRSDKSDARVRENGAEPVRCDLETVSARDLEGCEAVVHAAAHVEAWGTREDFWKGNVEGTERMLAAAREAGVRRFVHIGTEAVLLHGQHLRDADETHPYPDSTPFLYSETKAEAERRVIAANSPGFQTLVLRPRLVWGPGDLTILPEAKAMVERGAFMWVDGGKARTSTTHIANVVHGVELVLERGRPGQIYFVTDGEPQVVREFLTKLLATAGVEPPDRSIPSAIAWPVATALEAIWRTFGLRSAPPVTRFAIGLLCRDCTLNIDKARKELGYEPVIGIEEGLRELATGAR